MAAKLLKSGDVSGQTAEMSESSLYGSIEPAPDDMCELEVGGMIIGRREPKCSEKT
jgi:hypothetical protein